MVDDDVAGVFLDGGGGFAEADGANHAEEAAVGSVADAVGDVGVAAYFNSVGGLALVGYLLARLESVVLVAIDVDEPAVVPGGECTLQAVFAGAECGAGIVFDGLGACRA